MFCPHCGGEVVNDAVICVNCGRNISKDSNSEKSTAKWSTGAFVGLILMTVLVPYIGGLMGLIFGIIGLTNPAKKKQGLTLVLIAVGGFILSILVWSTIFTAVAADSYMGY